MSEVIVVKHGSSVSEHKNGIGLDQNKIDFHAYQHNLLRNEGFGTVEVSSGAVVEGKEYILGMGRNLDQYDTRALAKHGTAGQIRHWEDACKALDILVCQVLATHEEIDDTAEGTAIIGGIHSDIQLGSLCVLNENNAASEVELHEYEAGLETKRLNESDAEADNDWLAAHLAISLGASALLLLTNKDGFERDGKLLRQIKVDDVTELIAQCNGVHVSGTGGMKSKLLAAKRAAETGIHVIIGNAFVDNRRVLNGQGTLVIQ